MSNDMRECYEKIILCAAGGLMRNMNCAEYTHDNGVVSVRVARSGAASHADKMRFVLDVYTLAEIIRKVDGWHSLGAAALAEAILTEVNGDA